MPEVDLQKVRAWVDARNQALPERARGLIVFELDETPRPLTIRECRPPWNPAYSTEWSRKAVARLRYTATRSEWSLY